MYIQGRYRSINRLACISKASSIVHVLAETVRIATAMVCKHSSLLIQNYAVLMKHSSVLMQNLSFFKLTGNDPPGDVLGVKMYQKSDANPWEINGKSHLYRASLPLSIYDVREAVCARIGAEGVPFFYMKIVLFSNGSSFFDRKIVIFRERKSSFCSDCAPAPCATARVLGPERASARVTAVNTAR